MSTAKKKVKSSKTPRDWKTIDMSKVNLNALKLWIEPAIATYQNSPADEILVDYIIAQLESSRFPQPDGILVSTAAFIGSRSSGRFVADLWDVLAEAETSPGGIPPVVVNLKTFAVGNRIRAKREADEVVKRVLKRTKKKAQKREEKKAKERASKRMLAKVEELVRHKKKKKKKCRLCPKCREKRKLRARAAESSL